MTALQNQLQQVQLERTTLSSKLKASQAEISSLQHVRQWYQQQLALAQEARVRLQGEMAHIQVWLWCVSCRAGACFLNLKVSMFLDFTDTVLKNLLTTHQADTPSYRAATFHSLLT